MKKVLIFIFAIVCALVAAKFFIQPKKADPVLAELAPSLVVAVAKENALSELAKSEKALPANEKLFVEELERRYQGTSEEQLRKHIEKLEVQINSEIDKANAGQLSNEEMQQFSERLKLKFALYHVMIKQQLKNL